MRMTARGGAFVVLGFACVWLWVGATALPMPWRAVVGAFGCAVLLAVAWHVLHRPASADGARRFHRSKFLIAVAFEIVAANIGAWLLGRAGLMGYMWPMLGIVVALHFIGLWWASLDPRFITLTVTMLTVNVAACFFAPGGVAMLAITGLGSAAVLAAAMVRR